MSIYIIDIDGTICSNAYLITGDVYDAIPYIDRIEKINKLYDAGHTIILDTARGSETGEKHDERTKKQLEKWGVKYHKLRTGVKFFGDYYIDDRGIKDTDFFK